MEKSLNMKQTTTIHDTNKRVVGNNNSHNQMNSSSISIDVSIKGESNNVDSDITPKLSEITLANEGTPHSCEDLLKTRSVGPCMEIFAKNIGTNSFKKTECENNNCDVLNQKKPIKQFCQLNLPVSILSCEIIRSTVKKTEIKHRSTEYILKAIIKGYTFITCSRSVNNTIEWRKKVMRVIDQTSRIDEIILNVSNFELWKTNSLSSTELATKNDELTDSSGCQLKLNVMDEIKSCTLFPKTYKMDNCDGEFLIDLRINKLYPIEQSWNDHDEVIYCFNITCVNVDKPKYFKKQYYMKVELKEFNNKRKKCPKLEPNQRTQRKPCINNKIVYNNWIFIKILSTENVPILRMSLCDSKTDKVKGSRLFLPIDKHLTSEKDNQTITSIDQDMINTYTINPALNINRRHSVRPMSTHPIDLSFNLKEDEINYDDPLMFCDKSPIPKKPQLKKITDLLTLKNHIIGDINFYYGCYYTR